MTFFQQCNNKHFLNYFYCEPFVYLLLRLRIFRTFVWRVH